MVRLLAMPTIGLLCHACAQILLAAVAYAASVCPYGEFLNDGCKGAQASGIIPYPHLADYKRVVMINVVGGNGYINGNGYSWTSFGGGCSTNATGTVDVVNGALSNGQVTNEGEECTSRPTISVPAAAGAGNGGRIVATVYQLTPHNAEPAFNLPGVDYPIGYDSTLTLKDPTNRNDLPACATYKNHVVTIVSNN